MSTSQLNQLRDKRLRELFEWQYNGGIGPKPDVTAIGNLLTSAYRKERLCQQQKNS